MDSNTVDRDQLAFAICTESAGSNGLDFWDTMVNPPKGETRWNRVLEYYRRKADNLIEFMKVYPPQQGDKK